MKEHKNDSRRMYGHKRCDVAMDPKDNSLFNFGEDPGATDHDWWQ
ncbi:MAG: hypothetical protein PHS52_07580 [Desulfotomaculaceae bacterium]|nr:hypothetical protein [Desulfotomaculaceae bacterium]